MHFHVLLWIIVHPTLVCLYFFNYLLVVKMNKIKINFYRTEMIIQRHLLLYDIDKIKENYWRENNLHFQDLL